MIPYVIYLGFIWYLIIAFIKISSYKGILVILQSFKFQVLQQ